MSQLPVASTRIATLCLGTAALLVGGCGGAPVPGSSAEEATLVQPASTGTRQRAQAASPVVGRDAAGPAQSLATAAGQHFNLVLLNGRVVHQDLDQLDSQHGKGYQPLEAFIYLKGRPRSSSPVASVKPVCTPSQCEYLPPRKAGFAERYVISVDDTSLVQLSADEDKVVISARQLQLATEATVEVTLTVPGQPPVVKRIVYGAAPS